MISLLFHGMIKLFFFKPRPFMEQKVRMLLQSKKDSSFPSKHTILTFAVSSSILFYHRTLGVIMTVLSGLTGLSRIWVGHHYPSDVVGSALLGTLSSWLLRRRDKFIV